MVVCLNSRRGNSPMFQISIVESYSNTAAMFCPFFIPPFLDLRTAVRVLEQRQKADGKRHAGPEEDLRVSGLPKALQGSKRRATLH